eukprot:TRINITY_DN114543_c0_g1_i1.p1 TRINITY_DN114543_c0_g1~~TRINITY_DN114543_c0_g1_i1.p1  ORF type:complete len:177 (-),score=51.66 TRINITY_DN114543_c0_g1_i1:116-646(-)
MVAWDDRAEVLAEVRRNGLALRHATEQVRRDREVVLAAVKNIGVALEFAAEDLRGDKDVVLEALPADDDEFNFDLPAEGEETAEEVVPEREAALALGIHPLKFASESLRAQRETMLLAVEKNAASLEWIASELREDRQFLIEAVEKNKAALDYVPAELQTQVRDTWHAERLFGVLG